MKPRSGSAIAALAALGVVFGDIGTSPLYAFRECFAGPHAAHVGLTPQNLTGAASLIIWSLLLIVSFKYLFLILRLDNRGEGGILALSALIRSHSRVLAQSSPVLLLGLVGAALIYADGTLTPAISVLSAVEGFAVSVPLLENWVVPLSVGVLAGVFALQRHGSATVGRLFGPVVLLWFLVLAFLGCRMIVAHPGVLMAISPTEAAAFLLREWRHAMPLLAAVFLAVTGGEALYADLGHFGRHPIRLSWTFVVFPGLVLNYLGQAALLSTTPEAIRNPFFLMAAPAWRLPLSILATAAAIIASQALISGAFSLTAQAVRLGVLPRFRIRHTSEEEFGQIYVPTVNWLLAFCCILLVTEFRSSAALAGAYGVAIALTMGITSLLFLAAARYVWHWPLWKALLVGAPFLLIDATFLLANGTKILRGGWLPLAMGAGILGLMRIWVWGRRLLGEQLERDTLPITALLDELQAGRVHRVPGVAVFMTGGRNVVPAALLHNLKHNQILHEKALLLHVVTLDEPHADPTRTLEVEDLGEGLSRIMLRFGFADEPNVPAILKKGLPKRYGFAPSRASYFLGRESYQVRRQAGWFDRMRLSIFAMLSRNASTATAYFRLPPNRVVELGAQLIL